MNDDLHAYICKVVEHRRFRHPDAACRSRTAYGRVKNNAVGVHRQGVETIAVLPIEDDNSRTYTPGTVYSGPGYMLSTLNSPG